MNTTRWCAHNTPVLYVTHTHCQGIAKKVLIGAEIDETKNKASRTPRHVRTHAATPLATAVTPPRRTLRAIHRRDDCEWSRLVESTYNWS
jgi:hypothetical protein